LVVSALLALTSCQLLGLDSRDFPWDHEGYHSIHDAAVLAKADGRKLLVGISGSPG
jgi:hypothetical protein